MTDLENKQYVVVVQCHLVKQRCSGYFCEKAFHERSGGFAAYPAETAYRTLYLTCGGCCGRALQRKISHLVRQIAKNERLEKDRIVVQLSSCITNDSLHGPPCPHLGYLKASLARLGVDVREGTHISAKSEQRRQQGIYAARDPQ
jgi:predicted metal-binding protein